MPYELAIAAPGPITPRDLANAAGAERPGDGLDVQMTDAGESCAVVDDSGRMLIAMNAPVHLESPDELARILPGHPELEPPLWWHDLVIRADALEAAEPTLRRLALDAGAALIPLQPDDRAEPKG